MPGGKDPASRLHSTQSLWDNAMGEACADALDKYPGHCVLHVNGAFHSEYWDGTVRQLRLRKPEAKILTVAIVPVANPASTEVGRVPVADFVVLAEARAADQREGLYSVYGQQAIKYRLHVPEGASAAHPVPMLIWLSDDGFTESDGLDLWKDRLGGVAAVVAVQAPYRETQEDYGLGGRWFWPDSFAADVGSLVSAVERICGYVARYFPVDASRICVAGEGTGATVASSVALLADQIDLRAVSVNPSRYAKLKEFPLPLPELRDESMRRKKSLTVIAGDADRAWWSGELDQYRGVGLDCELQAIADDAWSWERQQENVLRAAMGLEPRAAVSVAEKRYIVVPGDTRRARHWARLHALWAAAESGVPVAVVAKGLEDQHAVRIPTTVRPHMFTGPKAIPECPGPFGGTTVLVVPADMTAQERQAWHALEENDPLAKASKFHRVRLAALEGDRNLTSVLTKLRDEGRKNVLIVPATFCADAAWMRLLRSAVRDVENEMTFHWLPGLGGRKVSLGEPASTASDVPLRHRLTVHLDPETHQLRVQDRIELPASLRRKGAEFTLSDALEITASNPPIRKSDGQTEATRVKYVIDQPPADGVLDLTYSGTVNFPLSDEIEQYTRGFRGTRGIISSEGVYLDGGSDWVPVFNDRLIRFSVEVRQPDGWHVISQGSGTSRDEHGRAAWDADDPMDQIYLVGGPLLCSRDTAGAVETLVYLHERDEALARKYLDATARYLEMYRKLIGPYPYTKFALVENFWETGYGMPSFTLLGPQVIRFPFIVTSSYPHEILHNWWGNSVFVDYSRGNWCEGLTAYLADHLIQEQRGADAEYRRATLQKYRNYVRQDRDFPLTEFRDRHSAATEAVGYGKALMMTHMLRRAIGDDPFRAGLAGFYRQQKGSRASFDDLRSAFETAADKQLVPFFGQWVERTGAPRLVVADVSVRESAGGFTVAGVLKQLQPGDPYLLDVPVAVRTATGQTSSVVTTRALNQPFEIQVDTRPLALYVDPWFDLFRLLDPLETPASIGQIFGEPHVLAVLPTAGGKERQELYERLVKGWSTDSHKIEVVSDADVQTLPSDRSLWILGHENRFARSLFEDAMGQPSAIRVEEKDFPLAGHSLVLVRRQETNVEKAVGLLTIDSAAAFAGMARKLPHYGKYTYLVFEGDEPTNIVKGQGSTDESPMVVDLRPQRDEQLLGPERDQRKPLAELPPVFASQALMSHVRWLAAPEREGRGLGSDGLRQSAEYIAQQMAQIGLQPAGDDGTWFQRFAVPNGPQGSPVDTVNVVGLLPGKRAGWENQSVILSAHFDHLGRGWPDVRRGAEGMVHPGADDNASGVAVMLELARSLAADGSGSRNLLVIAFSAEECGLQGSRHYAAHPHLPLAELRAVVNLDTVGRLFHQNLAIHATGTANEWPHIFRGCGFVTGIPSVNVPGLGEASDQQSFIEKGVPAVQVFTGAHEDYHRPTDTCDKIDAAGLVKVATFVKEAIVYLLERDEPLTATIQGAASSKPPGQAASSQGRRVTFGTQPVFDYPGPGVKIDTTLPNSPAARAGLQAGDLLLRIDGQDIANLSSFSAMLRKLEPNQQVAVEFTREGKPLTVKVTVEAR